MLWVIFVAGHHPSRLQEWQGASHREWSAGCCRRRFCEVLPAWDDVHAEYVGFGPKSRRSWAHSGVTSRFAMLGVSSAGPALLERDFQDRGGKVRWLFSYWASRFQVNAHKNHNYTHINMYILPEITYLHAFASHEVQTIVKWIWYLSLCYRTGPC